MFQSLSATEILTIAVVALIVIGPRQLPGIARRIGRYLGEIKRVAAGFREDLEREVGPVKEPLRDLKEAGREVSRPLADVRKSLDEAAEAAKRPEGKPGDKGADGGLTARWVGPEPKTGVPPDQAWEGMKDPVPPGISVPPPVSPSAAEDDDAPPPAPRPEAPPPPAEEGDSGAAR